MMDEANTNASPSSSSYEFTHAAAKLAVAQICESVGYNHFKDPALESLTTSALTYILHLGKLSTSFANLTGRSQCNVFDIILALEDLSQNNNTIEYSVTGSNALGYSVSGWSKLREIMDYVSLSEETPFSQPLPKFPLARSDVKRMIPSFGEVGEVPPGKHIPVWLPAFPDPHTYKETGLWVEKVLDPPRDKKEQAKQRRRAERALLGLQRKLIGSGRRERDGFSLLEVFGPVIGGEGEMGKEERRCVGLSKLRTEKKFLGEPLDLSLWNKGEERVMAFVKEEDRDDKRRRAEFILRQCMDNPVDLNQL